MDALLDSLVARLDPRIEREINRLRARYQLSLDEFRGLYVSDEQVDRLMSDRTVEAEDPPALLRPSEDARDDPRWSQMSSTFGLTPLEQDLLLIACAPECDPRYETLFAYLNDDVTRKWATVDLARRLLADVADARAVRSATAPGSRLIAGGLIRRIQSPSARPAALNAGLAPAPSVVHWLMGAPPGLALEHAAIRWMSHAGLAVDDAEARARASPLARLLEDGARGGPLPIVSLVGPPGSGRRATARAVASAVGRDLICVDLSALPAQDEETDRVLEALGVSLALDPSVVLVDGSGMAAEDDTHRVRRMAPILRAAARWPANTLAMLRASEEEPWRSWRAVRRLLEVRCDTADFQRRLGWWRRTALVQGLAVSEHDLEDLAGRFAFSRGQVQAAVDGAGDLAAMNGGRAHAGREEIATSARQSSDQGLGALATKVVRSHEWKDLVLPPVTQQRLRDFAAAIRQRHVVYELWGFGSRLANGVGVSALFAGSSGTGKTTAAGVVARELGLDLYKVMLSGVVSKYIGETEKNLDRIFAAARAANAIVFLDEAEAILGKRSEVKDAHDRYANIEVAYLLQKLEDHDGVVILATNLKQNIDEAFNRRMQYVIDFPRPDESERERIWRGMFPGRAPLDHGVDFPFLARQFDLAGGEIRNVVLDAAFLAAQDGGVIGMAQIIEGLRRQLTKQGKTPTGSEFRQYQGLLGSMAGRNG